MKKIIVPKSFRNEAIKSIIKRFVILLALLWVADCFVEYVLLYLIEDSRNMGNLSFCVFVLYAIPFLVTGIPFKLFDSDWYGEIISVYISDSKRKDEETFKKVGFNLTALVETQNGKLKTVKIFDEGELCFGNREKVYKVGDKVIHVYGMDYITPVRTLDKDRPIVCVKCGTKLDYGTKVCRCCGNSTEILLVDRKK